MEQATILMRFRISIAAILMIILCQWTVVHAQIPVPLPTITKQTAAKGDDPAESGDLWADLRAKRAAAEAELKAMSGVGSTAKDVPADMPKGQWSQRKRCWRNVRATTNKSRMFDASNDMPTPG